jgi:hypothetical protein
MVAVYTFDEDCVSDLHKDAYGFRPASYWFAAWNSMTDAEKQAEWDSLVAAMARREEERLEDEKVGIVRFEQSVARTITSGAGDRATAIKWLRDAEGGNDDIEFFEYLQGIPYGYIAKSNLSN